MSVAYGLCGCRLQPAAPYRHLSITPGARPAQFPKLFSLEICFTVSFVETAILSCALLADFFGGWEVVVLMLAILLVLFGTRNLPELMQGLGRGMTEFRKATDEVTKELERTSPESPVVFEALTHDNRSAEFIDPHGFEWPDPLQSLVLFLAQGLGIGRIPFAPGTFGSVLGLVWFGVLLGTGRYELYLAGALCGAGVSVWLCGAAERILKQKDPSSVVLDEIIAMPFCFLPLVTQSWFHQHQLPRLEAFFTGHGLQTTAVIFILFRLFDIAKPWPVRQSQRLPGGWGVTIDDLLAACYVALITALFLR